MKDLEKILKALANRRRIAILKHLKRHKAGSVAEISGEIGLSFKATSKHLLLLFNAEILEREQKSLQMFYRIGNPLNPVVHAVINLL